MRLLRLREERALSQRDLARMADVAQATVGQIERGERNAQPRTIRKLAEALEVEPRELMRRSGDG